MKSQKVDLETLRAVLEKVVNDCVLKYARGHKDDGKLARETLVYLDVAGLVQRD